MVYIIILMRRTDFFCNKRKIVVRKRASLQCSIPGSVYQNDLSRASWAGHRLDTPLRSLRVAFPSRLDGRACSERPSASAFLRIRSSKASRSLPFESAVRQFRATCAADQTGRRTPNTRLLRARHSLCRPPAERNRSRLLNTFRSVEVPRSRPYRFP